MKEIIVSIIMASYNSEDKIGRALESIRTQNYDQDTIEILVIDGGSSDKTRLIAEEYGARILNNPYRLPEPAKIIGLREAKGKYILIMDTDEKMANEDVLAMRVRVIEKHDELKCVAGGLQIPEDMKADPFLRYVNDVGDPFSCFIYKTYRGGSMAGLIVRNGEYDSECKCYIGTFKQDDIRPIGDSVTMMEREYILEHYSDMIAEGCTTAAIYDRVVADTGHTAYILGDHNFHYSTTSFKIYLSKLRFRVINNLFAVKTSGYSATAKNNPKLNRRKYLFPFYAVSTVFPMFDAIRMCIVYRHPCYLMHPIFAWYVMIQIIYRYMQKMVGINPVNESYGK